MAAHDARVVLRSIPLLCALVTYLLLTHRLTFASSPTYWGAALIFNIVVGFFSVLLSLEPSTRSASWANQL